MRKTERSCNSVFDNITHCKTKTSAKKVKDLAYDCNIDANIFTNKASRCEELLRKQGGGLKKKVSSKKVSSKKSPRKKVSSKKSPKKKVSSKKSPPAKHADEYKKLNEMKKKDLTEFSGHITQGKQDGKLVSVNKLRKHELILAIINGKNPKRSSEKRKSKRSSEKRKSKRFLINEITGMSGEKIKDKDYSYDEVLHRYNYLLKKEKKYLRKTETTFSFRKKYGKFKKHKNVVGYEGIFKAVVFDQKGLTVDLLEYLDDNYTESDEWTEIVNEKLEQHLENYYPEDQKYNFQFGFGGDDRDGSIYFFSKEPLYLPKPMEFKLYGKKYLMTWENEIILDEDLIEVEPIEPT